MRIGQGTSRDLGTSCLVDDNSCMIPFLNRSVQLLVVSLVADAFLTSFYLPFLLKPTTINQQTW